MKDWSNTTVNGVLSTMTDEQQIQPGFSPDIQKNIDLGDRLLEQGKLEEAIHSYHQVLSMKPDCAVAHFELGNALSKQKKLNEALHNYQSASLLRGETVILDKARISRFQKYFEFKVGLIATVPKSGTMYNNYFFSCYHQLLEGKSIDEVSLTPLPPAANLAHTIGLDILYMAHCICPGFQIYQGKYRKPWEKLNIYTEVFREHFIEILNQPRILLNFILDPAINNQVRIVYFYRNPLDQAVSIFRHLQSFRDQKAKYRQDSKGNLILMSSVREFIHCVGIDLYIKHFLTFKVMKNLYPKNILLCKYEDLVRQPKDTFLRVLNHFSHFPEDAEQLPKIEEALKLCSLESMKKLENLLGRSLGDDQIDPNERHIRDGSIGQWKAHLNEEDLLRINNRLNEFGLSLAEFDID